MVPPPDPHQPANPPQPTPLEGRASNPVLSGPGAVSGKPAHAASQPAVLSASPNALSLLKALRRRWVLALSLGILCGAAAAAGTWYFLPLTKHSARTLLRIPPERRFLLNTAEPITDLAGHQKNQIALVKSRLVLNAALKLPKVAQLDTIRAQSEPIEWLEKEVVADFSVAPEVLRISIAGERPEDLVLLVNSIREAYKREILDKERLERNERLTLVTELRQKYEGQLHERKNYQRGLAQTAGSSKGSDRALLLHAFQQQYLEMAQRELLQTESDLWKAKVELAVGEANEKQLAELNPPEPMVQAAVDKLPPVERARAAIDKLQERIDATVRTSAQGEQDPALPGYRKQLTASEAALTATRQKERPRVIEQLTMNARADVSKNLGAVQARIEILQERKKLLDKQVLDLRNKTESITKASLELEASTEDTTQLAELVKKITNEEEALKVELQAPSRVSLLEEGVVSRVADEKRRAMTASGAGAAGLALVLLAVAWWEFRARRINTGEEVVHGLGMRLVGALPESRRRWMGFRRAPDAYAQNILSESVDATRTLLLQAARSESLKVVMITSAVSGEGKTSLTTHLAASLAQVGHRTLLVDGDLRNPTAHRVFELAAEPGLSELLRGEVDIAGAVQSAGIDGLWMIPAGRWDNQASRALAQEPATALFRQLREDYDFILIDSSPVLPVADPLLLGQRADAVILSVLCDVSRMSNVYAAHRRLAGVGIRTLGVVVNGERGEMYGYAYPSRARTESAPSL